MRNASDPDVVWQTIANMRQLGLSLKSFYQILESDLVDQEPLSYIETKITDDRYTEDGWCCYAYY